MNEVRNLDTYTGITGWSGEVNTFTELPLAVDTVNKYYMVNTATGSRFLFNYKSSGLYYSNGTTWKKRSDIQLLLTDAEFVINNNADPTKQIRFDLSQLNPSTQCVLEVPTEDGKLALVSDITGGNAPIQIDAFSYITSGAGATIPYIVNNIRELDHEGNGTRTYYYQGIATSAKSGAKLKIWTETDDFAGNSLTATVYINGVVDTTIDALTILPTANLEWQLKQLTLGSNLAVGDVVDIKLISTAGANDFNAWRNFWID